MYRFLGIRLSPAWSLGQQAAPSVLSIGPPNVAASGLGSAVAASGLGSAVAPVAPSGLGSAAVSPTSYLETPIGDTRFGDTRRARLIHVPDWPEPSFVPDLPAPSPDSSEAVRGVAEVVEPAVQIVKPTAADVFNVVLQRIEADESIPKEEKQSLVKKLTELAGNDHMRKISASENWNTMDRGHMASHDA